MSNTLRPRSAFVEDILGVKESEFRANDELVRRAWKNPGFIENLKTGQRYKSGVLSTPSVGQLQEVKPIRGGEPSGKLQVLRGVHDLTKVDVGRLQAQPENKNAVFQVASNFNALELMNMYDERAMTEVGFYINDYTQGPFASISAAPGLLMRHYYPFCHPDRPVGEWRQIFQGKQIELLGDTPFQVVNGYLNLKEEDLSLELPKADVKVCSHREVQVTFGGVEGSEHAVVTDPSQTVDQVFTATGDLMGTNRMLFRENPDKVSGIIRNILMAAYEGTIRCAIQGRRKRVYLTLIGGGVFANPAEWIVEAILAQIPLIVESGLDVMVNTYRGMPDKAAFTSLVEGAKSTGGRLVDV